MRRETRLTILLTALVALLLAPTWRRDDSGVPAPPCYWQRQSDGALVACSELDPLPTGSGTTAGTDPTGWGKNWFAASGTVTGGGGPALFTGDVTVQQVHANGTGTALDVRMSQTGGRTFTLVETGTGDTCPEANAMLRFGGAFLVACNGSGTDDGLFRSGAGFETWTRIDLPSVTGFTVNALAGQGSTVLLVGVAGADARVCRSTNSGASFATCVDFAAIATPTRQGVVSPTASTWLVHDSSGNVSRSTDDGVSFTQVLTGLAGTGGLACLSATVCLVSDGVNVRRSADAGATWTTVFSAATGTTLRGFVDFGASVVNVFGISQVYRSADLGVTWQFQVNLPAGFGISGSGIKTSSTRNGRGVISADFGGGNASLLYSPIVGVGETIVAGQSGNRWDINGSGHGGVYQGAAAAASGAWPTKVVDTGGVNVARVTAAGQVEVSCTGGNCGAASPGNVTLHAVASFGAGTFTDTGVTGFSSFKEVTILCEVTFVSGTTPTLDIWVQRRQDSAIPNTRWTDIAHFTQFTAVSQRFVRFSARTSPGVTDEALQDIALAAGTVKQGPWTDEWRTKFTVGGTSPSFNFNCVAHRN